MKENKYTAEDLELAYSNGIRDNEDRCGYFNIEDYGH